MARGVRSGIRRTIEAMSTTSRSSHYALVREKNKHQGNLDTLDAASWLSGAPRGAYTTARTVRSHAVFEYQAHVERLVQSAKAMGAPSEVSENMEQRLRDVMGSAVHTFESRNPTYRGEMKLTALLTWDEKEGELQCHVGPLPSRPSQPVKVLVRGEPRTNAKAKDSDWVRARKPLEESKPDDVNEVVLEGEDGSLYEGLSSNFFVMQGGTLYTAGKNILEGTVRRLALEVCEKQGIPVRLDAPNVKDLMRWDGVLISSTSRLLLPVLEVSCPDSVPPLCRTFEKDPTVFRLEELVLQEVEAHSTPLF